MSAASSVRPAMQVRPDIHRTKSPRRNGRPPFMGASERAYPNSSAMALTRRSWAARSNADMQRILCCGGIKGNAVARRRVLSTANADGNRRPSPRLDQQAGAPREQFVGHSRLQRADLRGLVR